jgi:hypothetical protein
MNVQEHLSYDEKENDHDPQKKRRQQSVEEAHNNTQTDKSLIGA